MTVKNGMGDSTKHGLNKQNGSGKGASNVPLKKSTANPLPVVLKGQPAARAPSAPKEPPQATTKQGNSEGRGTVILSDVAAKGRNSTQSTFTAPRKDAGGSPTDLGFTKLGKV